MPTRLPGVLIMLMLGSGSFMAGCGGVTAPTPGGRDDGVTNGTTTGSFGGGSIAATHFFGASPDKTTIAGPVSSVVGPDVELRNFGVLGFVDGMPASGFVDVDYSNSNILITLTQDQSTGYLDVLRFTDVHGSLPDFRGVTINPTTNYAGFTVSRLRVEPDLIDLNLTGLRGRQGQRISLDFFPTRPSQ